MELFFDLVFVFAITQLSHTLLAHPTPLGALQTAMLFLGVWWVWIFTTWVTNWLDPERTPVRLMLFALMGAGLFMSMAIPQAFGERGLVFAVAYVAIQVGRSLFMLAALKGHGPDNYRNFQRITVWLIGSAGFWIAGGFADSDARLGFWGVALLIEYVGPALGFYVPRLGRSSTQDWDVEGHHIAERCGLFIIIALGESLLLTGSTFANGSWSAPTIVALAAAFSGSIAMWWIYFNIGADRAARKIGGADDPGRLARNIYTYIHLFIVGGIIISAASDELVLDHPVGHASATTSIAVIGGSAAFLFGNLLFKRATSHQWPLSHVMGIVALGAVAVAAAHVQPVILALATSVILIVVAIWESRSLQAARTERKPV